MGQRNGYWSLIVQKQSVPGAYLETLTLFEIPLDVGRWHDVKMQINWSASDTAGWIKLWLNGVPQTFTNGADTYFVRTLIPGTSTVYYKEGYYRQAMQPTGVVFHTGFRCATDQAAL
ncbi:heparin lyase I family protein [Rhodococcus opacus]|nr:heparin lyase I family protein [Rhodococcus opacus]